MASKSFMRRQTRQRSWLDALKASACQDCGGTFPPECMDFDHRDPEAKSFQIGANVNKAWSLLLTEIAKCDLVCANCHRIRTHRKH